MKIEVGKFYKTRGGEIVAIFEKIEGFNYPFQGIIYRYPHQAREISYMENGKKLKDLDSSDDIISEWNSEHNENHNENHKTELKWTQTIT